MTGRRWIARFMDGRNKRVREATRSGLIYDRLTATGMQRRKRVPFPPRGKRLERDGSRSSVAWKVRRRSPVKSKSFFAYAKPRISPVANTRGETLFVVVLFLREPTGSGTRGFFLREIIADRRARFSEARSRVEALRRADRKPRGGHGSIETRFRSSPLRIERKEVER